jgi:hypothetical protein
MNIAVVSPETLPSLIDRASQALASARSSAEVLEARDMAGFAYDAAKRAARMQRAKGAFDVLVAAAMRAQADALLIESQANRRLADEYDAAQERGEVASQGRQTNIPDGNVLPVAADLGLTPKQIHEARQVRDAEVAEPGIVKRVVEEKLAAGEEPTKAVVREAVADTAQIAKLPIEDQQAIISAGPEAVRAAAIIIREEGVPSQTDADGARRREAILHVAKHGVPERRASNANPYRMKSPAYDALMTLTGPCDELVEETSRHKPEFLLSACVDQAHRDSVVAVVTQARDFLNKILEAAHA